MLGPGHAAPLTALVAAQPLVRGRVQPVRDPLRALRESAELDGLGPERHRQDHAPAALLHGDGPLVPRAPLVPRDEESNAAHAPLGDDLHRDAGRGGVDAHRLHPGRHLHGLQRPGRGLAAPPSQGPPGRRGEGLSAHVARRRPPGVPAQDVPVGPAALVRPAVGQGAGHLPLRALALAPGRLLAPPPPRGPLSEEKRRPPRLRAPLQARPARVVLPGAHVLPEQLVPRPWSLHPLPQLGEARPVRGQREARGRGVQLGLADRVRLPRPASPGGPPRRGHPARDLGLGPAPRQALPLLRQELVQLLQGLLREMRPPSRAAGAASQRPALPRTRPPREGHSHPLAKRRGAAPAGHPRAWGRGLALEMASFHTKTKMSAS